MAYMHKETFEIVEKLSKPKDDCLAIDDAIVPSIQILNRKGYTTTECCAGHPFIGAEHGKWKCYVCFKNGVVLPSLPLGFAVMSRSITIDGTHMIIDDNRKSQRQYGISSEKLKTVLADKPELQKEISVVIGRSWKLDVDFYVFLRENAKALEDIYKWALNLPDFKS